MFFRAQDFATAWRLLDTMLTLETAGKKVLPTIDIVQVSVVIGVMLAAHGFMRERALHEVVGAAPRWLVGLAWGAMLWAIIVTQGAGNAFIYFQF